ncbi:MAG: FecCD family ABC transporter permease [Candidatus Nanopelagicales bacterium]|jgi:iron complex transport system permease protein
MAETKLKPIWRWQLTASSLILLLIACAFSITIGPVSLNVTDILKTLLGQSSNLNEQERLLLLEIRLPRVALAVLVGSALAASGAVYQTVFRNPLADPYLLGAAAGAGLGATIAFTSTQNEFSASLPLFAFLGGILAVTASFLVAGSRYSDPNSLLLSGIAVGSFATAVQTFLQQRNSDVLRPVYSWILGQLTVADWDSVRWAAIYIFLALGVLVSLSKILDALMLSDEEAFSLGVSPNKIRIIAVCAATLATATAVSVSGLIGFVGIVVPHIIKRLTKKATNRALLTIAIFGAAFLVLADLGARTLISPAEVPIGVITAFVGAPFFLLILRTRGGK